MNRKCFVITGASSGLGKAMAEVILSESPHFVISISRRRVEKLDSHDRFEYFHCDLANMKNTDFISDIHRLHKDKEVIYVNNAAMILPLASVGQFKPHDITVHLKVNVIGAVQLVNEVVRIFDNSRLSIVNISSGAASRPIAHWSLYAASKAFMKMFCEVLQLDHPRISVLNIDPGVIDTNMQGVIRDSSIPDLSLFKKMVSDNELRLPKDSARQILQPFL